MCRAGMEIISEIPVLPFPPSTTMPIEKMTLTRVIRPAVGARTKGSRSSLSVLRFYHPSDAAGSSNVSCWNDTCLSTETRRLNAQNQAATISKYQNLVASKEIWCKEICDESTNMGHVPDNSACTPSCDSRNYGGGLNEHDYVRVLRGTLRDVARCNTPRMKRTYITLKCAPRIESRFTP